MKLVSLGSQMKNLIFLNSFIQLALFYQYLNPIFYFFSSIHLLFIFAQTNTLLSPLFLFLFLLRKKPLHCLCTVLPPSLCPLLTRKPSPPFKVPSPSTVCENNIGTIRFQPSSSPSTTYSATLVSSLMSIGVGTFLLVPFYSIIGCLVQLRRGVRMAPSRIEKP